MVYWFFLYQTASIQNWSLRNSVSLEPRKPPALRAEVTARAQQKRQGFLLLVVVTGSISLVPALKGQKLAHSAAPPLPSELAPLGFAESPNYCSPQQREQWLTKSNGAESAWRFKPRGKIPFLCMARQDLIRGRSRACTTPCFRPAGRAGFTLPCRREPAKIRGRIFP